MTVSWMSLAFYCVGVLFFFGGAWLSNDMRKQRDRYKAERNQALANMSAMRRDYERVCEDVGITPIEYPHDSH